jgi:hypothetical protein
MIRPFTPESTSVPYMDLQLSYGGYVYTIRIMYMYIQPYSIHSSIGLCVIRSEGDGSRATASHLCVASMICLPNFSHALWLQNRSTQ